MEIQLARDTFGAVSTMGLLTFDDGGGGAHTLELPTRDEKPRAIPTGHYRVHLRASHKGLSHTDCLRHNVPDRLAWTVPELEEVPGFDNIEIHPGNTPVDTVGCIIPGVTRSLDSVGSSRQAFSQILVKIDAAVQFQEEVWITVGGE